MGKREGPRLLTTHSPNSSVKKGTTSQEKKIFEIVEKKIMTTEKQKSL